MDAMHSRAPVWLLLTLLPLACGAQNAVNSSVLQYHKNPSKDGFYVDSLLTGKQSARTVAAVGFVAPSLTGQSYAQLLYVDRGSLRKDIIISATQANVVTAFAAADGTRLWQRKLDNAVPSSSLPCGNISPLVGVLATPVVDTVTNRLVLSAKTTADGGKTQARAYAWCVGTQGAAPGHCMEAVCDNAQSSARASEVLRRSISSIAST